MNSPPLFQSARRSPGAELLGVGVPLLFCLLVGSALVATYRSPDCELVEPELTARPVRSEFDRKNWDAVLPRSAAFSAHR